MLRAVSRNQPRPSVNMEASLKLQSSRVRSDSSHFQQQSAPTWSLKCDVSRLASLIARMLCQLKAACPAKTGRLSARPPARRAASCCGIRMQIGGQGKEAHHSLRPRRVILLIHSFAGSSSFISLSYSSLPFQSSRERNAIPRLPRLPLSLSGDPGPVSTGTLIMPV